MFWSFCCIWKHALTWTVKRGVFDIRFTSYVTLFTEQSCDHLGVENSKTKVAPMTTNLPQYLLKLKETSQASDDGAGRVEIWLSQPGVCHPNLHEKDEVTMRKFLCPQSIIIFDLVCSTCLSLPSRTEKVTQSCPKSMSHYLKFKEFGELELKS